MTSECLISVLKAKISRQDTYESGLGEFTPIFMQFSGHTCKVIISFLVTDTGIWNDFTLDNIVFVNLLSIWFYW